VFEDLRGFEARARSDDAEVRAANVATLVDALDLCNMLVLGSRIVFDSDVGGGRQQALQDQIDLVAKALGDATAAEEFRASFGGVAPASEGASRSIELAAARSSTAFFPRLARCAANVLDLFHLPHMPPTKPHEHLIRFVDAGRPPSPDEIERIQKNKEITGRRFYAALLADETAFRALVDSRAQVELTNDVLAVLFMNFRLRLAEQRSLAQEKVLVGTSDGDTEIADTLVYLPSMGRRDFSREFSRFIRWGVDPRTRHGHALDLGLREYVLEDWEGVGCQLQISERRAIPLVVASVLGSEGLSRSRRPETLILECLRWRREHQSRIRQIRKATREFESLDEESRKDKAAEYVANLLKSPSTEAARNRALGERLSVRDGWLGLGISLVMSPLDTLKGLVIESVDKVRRHFEQVGSREYAAATHLSEAARPLLAGVGADLRQRLVDVFGGTVIDARNPKYDPDRFPAAA
jgi:hypothetical protein